MTTSPNTSTPTEGQEATNNNTSTSSSAESKETTASDMPTKDINIKKDEGASTSAQPSNKKRRSNIQLNKDDYPEGNSDDDDGELNDEGTKRSDPFKRASEVSFYYITCYLIYIMYCNLFIRYKIDRSIRIRIQYICNLCFFFIYLRYALSYLLI